MIAAAPAQFDLPDRPVSRPFLVSATFAGADLLSLSSALFAGFFLWSMVGPPPRRHVSMGLAVAFSMVSFAFRGLYPGIGLTPVEQIRRVCLSVTIVYLMLTASMVLLKDFWANTRGGFLLAWGLSLILAPLGRWACAHFLSQRTWWACPS